MRLMSGAILAGTILAGATMLGGCALDGAAYSGDGYYTAQSYGYGGAPYGEPGPFYGDSGTPLYGYQPGYVQPYGYQPTYVQPYAYQPGWSGGYQRHEGDWHDHGNQSYRGDNRNWDHGQQHGWNGQSGGGRPVGLTPPPPRPAPSPQRPANAQTQRFEDALGFRPNH